MKDEASLVMKNLLIISMLLAFCSMTQAEGAGKIVKWVDSKGVTHYGDKMPSEQVAKTSTEMSKTGVVIKRNAPPKVVNTVVIEQQSEQDRQDKVLMSSYTNAQEIDAARDRSLQMDQANLSALTQQKETLTARNQRNQNTAESFKARNKPLPLNIAKELTAASTESKSLDRQIADKKLSMENTRKRFAADKARFIALKQPSATVQAPATAELNGSEMAKINTTPIVIAPVNSAKSASVP